MDHKRELNSAGIVGFEDEATTGISVESTSEQEINTSPFGIGITLTGNGNTTTVGGGLAMKTEETITRSRGGAVERSEKISFEQSISTPVGPLLKNSHTSNSDVFIGVSKNKAVTDKFIFNGYSLGSASDRLALKPMADIAGAAGGSNGPGPVGFTPEMNGSAYYPALPDYEEWKVFNATGDWAALTKAEVFALGWNTVSTESVLPAANFIKTQYQIESIDIPSLIALRDQFFTSNPDLYRYPDGTPSNLTSSLNYDELPESMRLANNDDPRWSNYYFDWVICHPLRFLLLNMQVSIQ